MKPVKPLLTVLAVFGLSVSLAGAFPDDDAVEKELKALAGTWQTGSGVSTALFTFNTAGEYTFGIPNEPPQKGTFTIDPTKRPRTLDADGGETLYIYELKGKELTLAYDGDNAKRRPRAFSGKNVVVMKCKKVQ